MSMQNLNKFQTTAIGLNRPRSTFKNKFIRRLDMKPGLLYPVYVKELLPGDNINEDIKALARMNTPLFPVMDNAFLDLYAFKVPNRIVYHHWEEFMGENKKSYFDNDPTTYQVPRISYNSAYRNMSNHAPTDLLSYLGMPPFEDDNYNTITVNALPLAAYCQVCNDWFRREAYFEPINMDRFNNGDSILYTQYSEPTSIEQQVQKCAVGHCLYPVAKYRDYFTSALPKPQFGEAVTFNLGDFAPVIAMDADHSTNSMWVRFAEYDSGNYPTSYKNITTQNNGAISAGDANIQSSSEALTPVNLYANLIDATKVSIQQMRLAVSTQRFKEILSAGGSRYIETLFTLFGVKSSDARLQRSEYLGGCRTPIGMTSVAQTSASDSVSPQGNLSAYSITGLQKDSMINCFSEEHGFLIVVGCIRVSNSYSQGLHKMFTRFDMYDYYNPCFANLGEMPVYDYEIFLNKQNYDDKSVFGYQESWLEYKVETNKSFGLMNPAVPASNNGIGVHWSYGSVFDTTPSLTPSFIAEDADNVQRTLAVQESYTFICEFAFDELATRVMPKFPNPALLSGM